MQYFKAPLLACSVALTSSVVAWAAEPVSDRPAQRLPEAVSAAAVLADPAESSSRKPRRYAAAWQVTRARFHSAQSATQTESFRETWQLRVRREGGYALSSPRATVAVQLRANGLSMPGSLVAELSDYDFARLIGVEMPAAAEQATAKPARVVSLSLSEGEILADDIVLYALDDEHLAVHLDKTR